MARGARSFMMIVRVELEVAAGEPSSNPLQSQPSGVLIYASHDPSIFSMSEISSYHAFPQIQEWAECSRTSSMVEAKSGVSRCKGRRELPAAPPSLRIVIRMQCVQDSSSIRDGGV